MFRRDADGRGPVVAHVVQHLRPGGIESLVLGMIEAEAAGLRQIAVSLDGTADAAMAGWPRLRPLAGRLHFMAKPGGLAPALVPRLARLFRAEGVGVVQTHHEGPLLYGGPAARLVGARLVHVEHDAWHLADPRAARRTRLLMRALRPARVAVSGAVAEAGEAALGLPFRVIGNAVDDARFTPGDRVAARRALGLPPVGPLVVAAARLEPVKGIDVLIAALAHLPGDIRLAIAGDGSRRADLEAQAAALAPGRVIFLGRCDDMPALYRAADVFALPSRHEGLPLALLEAQSCGCPAVAADVGAVAGALDPATGRLVPPEAPGALAAALAEVLAGGAETAGAPRAFIRARHSHAAMLSAYHRIWGLAA